MLTGCFRVVVRLKNPLDSFKLPGLFLIGVMVLPFLFYWLIGLSGIRFGQPRNFAYLLPLYLLLVFYGLRMLIPTKIFFYLLSFILSLALLVSGVFAAYPYLKRLYMDREMIKSAKDLGAAGVVYT